MKEKDDIFDDNQIYEIGFHILPTVLEENLQGVVSGLEELLIKNGGLIISQEFPKAVNLSYGIKKRIETKHLNFNKAYFGWVKFEAPPVAAEEIKKGVEDNGNILRFVIVKTVRESTMHTIRPPMVSRESGREETVRVPKEKVEISEAEIDKSIEELLVN